MSSEGGTTPPPPLRVLITRPAADAQPLAAALAAAGILSVIEPLLAVVAAAGPPPDLAGVQALLATSANGIRVLAGRSDRRDLPVYAVGDATARAAAAAGYTRVASAAGDVEALADLVLHRLDPAAGAVLHVAGSDVAGDLAGRLAAAGFRYRRAVLYRAVTAERLPAATAALLAARSLAGVVVYSPRTAATLVSLIAAAGLAPACRALCCFALSPAVAARAATLDWRRIVVAARPDQPAMIDAIVAALCRDPGG